MNRRGFISMLAGSLAAPLIVVPHRSIFLPPIGGWPHGRIETLQSLIIPRSDIHLWAKEIAAGRMIYDAATECLSLVEFPEESKEGDIAYSSDAHLDRFAGGRWQQADNVIGRGPFVDWTNGHATPIRLARPTPEYQREMRLAAELRGRPVNPTRNG